MAVFQNVQQIAQGVSAVQNILNHNNMPAGNVLRQVFDDLDLPTGGRTAAIGGHGHKIQGTRQANGPAQVRHKDEGPPEDADQHNLFAGIVRLNLPGNFVYPGF